MFASIWQNWFSVLVLWLKSFIMDFLAAMRAFGDVVLESSCEGIVELFPALDLTAATGLLDKINYFFPLSEAVTLCTVVFTVWISVWLYKAVKSWIPTVSS